jgi:hypothetical protein
MENSMSNIEPRGVNQVFGTDGAPLDLRNLPESHKVRWVMRRKLEVLTAVRFGLLNIDDACKWYGISMEELLSWKSALDLFGPVGLHASRLRRQNSVSNTVSRRREEKDNSAHAHTTGGHRPG